MNDNIRNIIYSNVNVVNGRDELLYYIRSLEDECAELRAENDPREYRAENKLLADTCVKLAAELKEMDTVNKKAIAIIKGILDDDSYWHAHGCGRETLGECDCYVKDAKDLINTVLVATKKPLN